MDRPCLREQTKTKKITNNRHKDVRWLLQSPDGGVYCVIEYKTSGKEGNI